MEQLQELENILTKGPVIHTFEAEEIRQNPRFVDETYTLHAETHMPLGNTSEYVNRMFTCLLKNKTTFVGGVVGDYGLGKTSLLAYLWKQCENNDVIAVPPYVWFTFQENFQVIYSWTKYKLEQRNLNLIPALDTIYSKYRDPSVENRAKLYAQNFGVDYERARRLIQVWACCLRNRQRIRAHNT